MKIFLTGIAGFIGSHLARRLLDRGNTLTALDNFDETLYPALLHERNLATVQPHERLHFERGDLLDAALVDRLTAAADVVVHLAGLAGVRPSLSQPLRYQRVNIEGTLNILESCRAHKIGKLVFASSSSVYGARDASEVPFREDDPATRPASPYAASKRAGELFLSNYSDLYGLTTIALRFFTVYGPRQRPEMAIHKFARLIADKKPLPFYGDGQSARDYTFIDDIVDGVVAAIDRAPIATLHRVYNLGGSRTTTLARLVELIENGLGERAILDRQPDQPGDVPITYADGTRSRDELGYSPHIAIEDGIARFCQWFKKS